MRSQLSPAAWSLVVQLYQGGSGWQRLTRHAGSADLVTAVEALGEPLAARDLLPLAASAYAEVGARAAQATAALVSSVPRSELATFDELVRAAWFPPESRWHEIRPADLEPFMRDQAQAPFLLGLAACHRNGHVRQRAVELLSLLESGDELPFLLLRVSDWVEPVREAAARAARQRIRPDYARHFAACPELVMRLARLRRTAGTDFHEAVLSLMSAPAVRPLLLREMPDAAPAVRRWMYGLMLQHAGDDGMDIFMRAVRDPDPVVRAAAIERSVDLGDRQARLQLLQLAYGNGVPWLRARALAAIHRVDGELGAGLAFTALLDPAAAVRAQGRFVLMRSEGGVNDFAGFYRDTLQHCETARCAEAALLGLGETGDREDIRTAAARLADRSPRVRRAAIRAIGQLGGAEDAALLVPCLDDPTPSVAAQAARVLLRYRSSIGPDAIRHALQSPKRHLRLLGVALSARLPKWDALTIMLEGCDTHDDAVRRALLAGLRRWVGTFNSSFTQPSAEQCRIIRSLLDTRRFILGAGLHRVLSFHADWPGDSHAPPRSFR